MDEEDTRLVCDFHHDPQPFVTAMVPAIYAYEGDNLWKTQAYWLFEHRGFKARGLNEVLLKY